MIISYKNPFGNYSDSEVETIQVETASTDNTDVLILRFIFKKNKNGNRPADISMTLNIEDIGQLDKIFDTFD